MTKKHKVFIKNINVDNIGEKYYYTNNLIFKIFDIELNKMREEDWYERS